MLFNLNMGKFLFLIVFVNVFYNCKKKSDTEIVKNDGNVNFVQALAGVKAADGAQYFNQLANDNNPDSTCCLTSASMILLNTLIAAGKDLTSTKEKIDPDALFARYGQKKTCGNYRMWQCSPGLRNLLHEEIGLWHKTGTIACETSQGTENDIQDMISRKIPLIYHGKFTKFGHCITITGYTMKNADSNNWTLKVHDPYGKWLGLTNKYDKNSNDESSQKGKFQTYNYSNVRKVSSIGAYMRFEFVAFSDQVEGLDLTKWKCSVRKGDSPEGLNKVNNSPSDEGYLDKFIIPEQLF